VQVSQHDLEDAEHPELGVTGCPHGVLKDVVINPICYLLVPNQCPSAQE
jgi:hypothetical protein